MTLPTLGFIGTGTVGSALARALSRAGYRILAVHNRTPEKASHLAASIEGSRAVGSAQDVVDACDLVFLTVPDDFIEPLCQSLDWTRHQTAESPSDSAPRAPARAAIHTSGAASIDILQSARDQGAEVGVFHPLQTLARPEDAERNLPGSGFGIEASSDELRATLEEMARALGGTPLLLGGEKALYHASAVIASNYLVTLLGLASSLWEPLGLTRDEGLRALLPLVRGTLNNLERIGLPDALTGPIARGDAGTISRHLEALGRVAPELLPVYKELARRTIPIARAKGSLDEAGARRLAGRLEQNGDETHAKNNR